MNIMESFSQQESNKKAKQEGRVSPTSSGGLSQGSVCSTQQPKKRKHIHDIIYGNCDFHPLLVAVIDSKPFQRLRKCKQLGTAEWVYPSARHTRFEHSLGVCYRARSVVERLRNEQRGLNITDKDVLCVCLAGLCHDLGHGPFSHMYERLLRKCIAKSEEGETKERLKGWTHEQMSCDIFDYIMKDIDFTCDEYGALDDQDLLFVREMIIGKDKETDPHSKRDYKERRGRPADKNFLYDIVNNADHGLDVDKLDYLHRDKAMALGEDHKERMSNYARVCRVSGNQDHHADTSDNMRTTICWPEKMYRDCMRDCFQTRFEMHQKVYQHKKVCTMDEMIADVLCHAFEGGVTVRVDGSSERCSLAEACLSIPAFVNLHDNFLELVADSTIDNEHVRRAQALLTRLERRDLYDNCGIYTMDTNRKEHRDVCAMDTEELVSAIIEHHRQSLACGVEGVIGDVMADSEEEEDKCVHMSQISATTHATRRFEGVVNTEITEEDFTVLKSDCHYGAKDKNPLDDMHFYYKDDDAKEGWSCGLVEAHKVDSDKIQGIPAVGGFRSREMRVVCKTRAKKEAVSLAARGFFQNSRNKCHSPLGESSQNHESWHSFSQSFSQDYRQDLA
uniref:HD/PDEase domain-containing protein n=2 Tax=Hemiselmis andersenii TaxID=464988 RepID=A0A7S0TZM1_HEMAN